MIYTFAIRDNESEIKGLLAELGIDIPEAAAPVLRMYLEQVKRARPYFDVTVDSPLDDVAAEAHRHPVFHLEHVH